MLWSIFNKALNQNPTNPSINYAWNGGSLLGMILVLQMASGVLLSFFYAAEEKSAFSSIIILTQDVFFGWFFRLLHANGATFFFIFLYFHISRGLYMTSFRLKEVWMTGMSILVLVMAAAFLGYVLPMAQMSFWGATVITNLFSSIPFKGVKIVEWVWGGFSVNYSTLTFFFSLHYLVPFMIIFFMIIHLFFLHSTGSTSLVGVYKDAPLSNFTSLFGMKDMMNMFLIWVFFLSFLFFPFFFSDSENFISANPLLSPLHIQPEWYFLFAYAILRSIPNKTAGIVCFALSIFILYFLSLSSTSYLIMNIHSCKLLFWILMMNFFGLTFIGAQPVEDPFILVGSGCSLIYFLGFSGLILISFFLKKLLN